VRIISGTARGVRLATFPGGTIRPTPDRVREAVFSILTSRLGGYSGRKVLDLFSGTGAMAIEALSRGAARAWLVDNGPLAAKIIPGNLCACRLQQQAELLRMPVADAIRQLAHNGPFDLIFLDPPYGQGLAPSTLHQIEAQRLLAPNGLIVAETASRDEMPEAVGNLMRIDERRYGTVNIHLYTDHAEAATP
jgi:16S rRNA (guanine(966)-N(2))-methyltransferase RsmD